MGDAAEPPALAVPDPPPSLLKLTTLETTVADVAASSRAAGLAALRQLEILDALRRAMHVVGDPATMLPAEHKGRIADRYIHSRLVVDRHTAGAVLLEAFSQSRLFILRDFPGVLPPTYPTVAALLKNPPTGDSVAYNFNDRGTRVHYVFTSLSGDSPHARASRDWWRDINQLPDVGKEADMSAGTQWNFVSRRGMSSLHMDTADGTNTQHRGKKLWVLVRADEAEQHGIVPLTSDAMREAPAGTHRLSAWLACDSFQWCILDEGDTIITPRDRLHAVCCIGDIDAVSSGSYCWLHGTPPLPPSCFSPRSPASASSLLLLCLIQRHHQHRFPL